MKQRNTSRRLAVALALLAAASWLRAPAGRQGEPDLHAWTLTSLERALRDDPPGPSKKAVIHAARNEWESFQIALRSPRPVRITDVVIGPVKGPTGKPARDLAVRVYREHQLHITRPTYRNEDFRAGWYPDALIPLRQPLTGEKLTGGRFRAVPFDLPADETHAFWFDVLVPRNAEPGTHACSVRFEIDGAPPVEVPFEVEVWAFALPARASMYTQFGSPAERVRRYYGNLQEKGVVDKQPDFSAFGPIHTQCARLLGEHRLNCELPPELIAHTPRDDGSFELTEEQLAGIRRWAKTYHVNSLPVPPPHRHFKDPERDLDKIHRWLKSWDRAFDAAGLGDLLVYTYLKDEPNDPDEYKFVQQWGKVMRESGSRVKALVVEQTKTQNEEWGNLYGAVDIWVPLFSLFEADSAKRRRALGEQIWTYTALCQRDPTPWWHTDFPLCHYRVPTWIAWRHEMKGLLYWGGLSFWYHVDDPWIDPATYQPGDRSRPIEKRRVYNGEGCLVYPARDVGFDGIVPSMRLKVLRDALEDFDYLAMLETRGLREKALEIVKPIGGDWHKWSVDPNAYRKARMQLATLILENQKR